MFLNSIKSTDKEKSISEILPTLSELINPKYRIIKKISKIPEYFDDPKIFHFGAILYPVSDDKKEDDLSNSVGGYSLFSEDEALLKCLGEALERYCLRTYRRERFIEATYKSLAYQAVNPETFVSISQTQRRKKSFEIFNFTDSTPFSWIKGKDLINNRSFFVPAQLIYLSYKLGPRGKWIYLPISTGAAGGSNIASAIVRGAYEVIERDAFLVFYLNKLPAKKIDLHCFRDAKIKFCVETIESYNLRLYCFDITTELKVPTFLSVIIDETGIGPAISFGLKTNLNIYMAIIGSIQETLHPRGWIRRKVEDNPNLLKKVNRRHMQTLEERALLWYSRRNIKKLNFLLQQPLKKIELKPSKYSLLEQLEILLKTIKRNNMDIFYVDITAPLIKKLGYHVAKVLIPQLTPFYLLEDYPYYGGTRLYKLPKMLGFLNHETNEDYLNKFPHPFL